jgi:tryptophanyl-tRNA synthetase
MQDSFESYVFIADMHALTTMEDAKELRRQSFNIAAAYLACGLDPKKVTLYRQSDIGGAVGELTWIFNCLTTVAYLERGHAYKDAIAKGREATVGLFDYPMLMAADILLQDPDVVPVGADQKQHVEFARDTAQKFNNAWGETFKLPNALILEATGIVPGIDGKKMSKSYKNVIPLFGTDAEIQKAVMSIVTDSSGTRPENVYAIHKLFRSEGELEALYAEHAGKYKALKDALLADILAFVQPMRAKYDELQKHPEIVEKVLADGAASIAERVSAKMKAVKAATGLR